MLCFKQHSLLYLSLHMQTSHRIPIVFICISLVAAAAGLWLYNPLPLYFLNDDFIHIPLSKAGVLFQRKSFRPICDLSIALDYFFWKKEAVGYHFTNLLMHISNTLLVYVLSVRLYEKYLTGANKSTCILIAAFFFIYPFHSETIYWIIGRSGSLGAVFFLSATIFYLRRNDKSSHFLLSLFLFSIGLLTYESVWAFPLVAGCISWLDRTNGQSTFRKEAKYLITIVIVFFIFLLFRYAVLGEIIGNYEAAGFKTFDIKTLFLNGVRLFVRSFVPPVQSILVFYASAFAIITILIPAFISLRKNKEAIVFAGFLFVVFIALLLPYLSLGINTHSSEGERFLYLPSVFVCMLTVHLIFASIKKMNTRIILFALIMVYSIYFLFQSKGNYTTASQITKLTVHELNKIEGKTRLFVDSLPQDCNGAIVFRLGFYEATKWMKRPPALENIFVSSPRENIRKSGEDYKVIYKDSSFLRSRKSAENYFDSDTDVAFIYTDSALIVIK